MAGVDISAVGSTLHLAAVTATPAWVARCVRHVSDQQGLNWGKHVEPALRDAAERATDFVDERLRELVDTDIDRQKSTPLEIFREAVRFPVEVLHTMGAGSVHRGDMARWAFPNDPFGITPGNLSDIGPEVHEAGILWGASKAALHLERRRREGQL